MNRLIVRAACAAICVAALTQTSPAQERGQTYFVSPRGDDGNGGSESRPLRTLQRAADLVSPGDTVIVEDGTYTASGGSSSCAPKRPVACLTRGGTATARVTFRARHQGGARLDGEANTSTEGFYFKPRASYVTLDGFEIFGMGVPAGATSGSAHGVMIDVAHDIVLTRLHIHDIGRTCTSTRNGLSGVFVRVPRVTITRSIFHDIGRAARGERGCGFDVAPSLDHGIYVSGAYDSSDTPGTSDLVISNNVFYRLTRGWAVQLYPGTLTGVTIVNNTFAFANPGNVGHIVIDANTTNTRIANNIFYRPNTAAINYRSGTQVNLQIRNNLVDGADVLTSMPRGATIADNRQADPRFVNALTPPFDFHLRPGSPAADAGRVIADLDDDFDGVRRTGDRFDIGAYRPPDRPRETKSDEGKAGSPGRRQRADLVQRPVKP